jgi:hypothetical protein
MHFLSTAAICSTLDDLHRGNAIIQLRGPVLQARRIGRTIEQLLRNLSGATDISMRSSSCSSLGVNLRRGGEKRRARDERTVYGACL